MPSDGKAWYDISVIPPMPGHCRSFEDCKTVTKKRGFNVPVAIAPKQNANNKNCRTLVCAADDKQACADAYHYPDDIKTHDCPVSTEFDVVFCPNGSGGSSGGAYTPTQAPTQAPVQTQKPAQTPTATIQNNNNQQNNKNNNSKSGYSFGSAGTNGQNQGTVNAYGTPAPATTAAADNVAGEAATLGKVRASYTYRGKQAGNVPGSYDRVTQLSGCKKQRVSVNSPVGPLSEEVSLVFRGPMDIFNIAVFDGSAAGNGSFTRVSSYDRDASDEADNLVFLNNKNVDYSGGGQHSPQGYAGADGVLKATSPTKFKGVLQEASNPSQMGAGPGIQTGAEVNIMTGAKCGSGGCPGYHSANDYRGWDGGRKVFVTKVQMPQGSQPNQPALWMLNAQVLHSNQYGCNCRGMGAVGGCGELDIAEVIETNAGRDHVSTHYYFYDGSVVAPGGDNFAARPVDRAVAYVTIIDDQQDGGVIKILELEDFDFTQTELSKTFYDQMLSAP